MRAPPPTRIAPFVILLSLLAHVQGCSDVGDSSALPGNGGESEASQDGTLADSAPGAATETSAAGEDGAAPIDEMSPSSVEEPTPVEEPPPGESMPGPPDSAAIDARAPSMTVDASGPQPEASSTDATPSEATSTSEASVEAAANEAGETGTDAELDAGVDSTMENQPEAGNDSAAQPETDADTGGGGTGPCIYSNAQGTCSPTEQIIINYDTAHNQSGESGCYVCMAKGDCLDSAPKGSIPGLKTFGETMLECGDQGNASENYAMTCLDDLTCVLTSNHCTTAAAGAINEGASVSDCYCGANQGAACIATPTSPIGTCAATITADMSPTNNPAGPDNANPTEVLVEFADTTLATGSPGGVGNQLLNCALASKCDACFN
jgi:hypothetical protein